MKQLVPLFLALILLPSCATLDWLSGDNAAPLKGVRISVLELSEARPFVETMDHQPILIPEAQPVGAWRYSTLLPNALPENIALAEDAATPSKRKSIAIARSLGKSPAQPLPVIVDGHAYFVQCNSSVADIPLMGPSMGEKKRETRLFNTKHFSRRTCQSTSMTEDQGQLYLTLGDLQLLAVDAKTQTLLWQYDAAGPIQGPVLVHRDAIVLLTTDNTLTVLDRQSGTLKWRQQLTPEELGMLGQAIPVAVENLLLVPYSNGIMPAYGLDTGQLLWSVNLAYQRFNQNNFKLSDVSTTPVVRDGVVYVASNAGALFAIRVQDGSPIWQAPLDMGASLWVSGNTLFSRNFNQELVAYHRATGAVKWRKDLKEMASSLLKKKKKLSSFVASGPIMVEGRLLLSTSTGSLLVISPKDGALEHAIDIPPSHSPPMVADGRLYSFGTNGSLTSISKQQIVAPGTK